MSQQSGIWRPRKRIWIQHVVVEADKLQVRLDAAKVGGLTPWQEAISQGVAHHISKARAAALREDPIPGGWANWWRGTLVEAAYQNLRAARSGLIPRTKSWPMPWSSDSLNRH
ncbi:hypothetical protein EV644_12410 [Kribbella orskensis]|uniref:Uncharacterized protein n=1 Tax=Kribbella orskensis TaxID=2512216 RepID=A0ABY2B9M1_9ACTN|nr:hypothetical protein EV642_12688 [Kribbella sp. VKM Ac-2500]TCO12886.1 hypothetical protein EV644_12410 [Kribbella orskensis]